ncbi:PLPL9, partial [Fasciola gigantica]
FFTLLVSLLNRYDPLSGLTPLRIAIGAKDLNLVEFLLTFQSIRLDEKDENGCTVLHAAAAQESDKLLSLLLPRLGNQVVDINSVNDDGNTALNLACKKPSRDCIELLLNAGADPLIGAGDLPFHQAVVADSIECVDLIYKYCPQALNCQQPSTQDYPIHLASNPTMFRRLNELGANLDAQNSSGLTVLHIKVREDDLEGVLNLLNQGVDTNLGDKDGATPLHYAIMFNASIHIIRALIVFESDPCALDNRWRSPRHLLCAAPNEDLALYTLHAVGARRCSPKLDDCTAGCMDIDSLCREKLEPFDGTAPEVTHHIHEETANLFEEIFFAKSPPKYGVKGEEDSDSEAAASASNVTVAADEGFQNHRLSRYSRSLRRFSRHDFVWGSASPLSLLNESGPISCTTDSGPLSSRRAGENRSSFHSQRCLSYEVQSNPESPQRFSTSPIQLTMHSDDETNLPEMRNHSNGNPFVPIRPTIGSSEARKKRMSRVNVAHQSSARLRFLPRECCCDEKFLNELYNYPVKTESQSKPDAKNGSLGDLNKIAQTDNQSKDALMTKSPTDRRMNSWSLSSSSASLSTDEYGLSKDHHAHTDTEHAPESTSPKVLMTVPEVMSQSPTPVHHPRCSTTGSATAVSESGWSCGPHGYRVLSLDGGGVRGLILIQLLRALEKASGRRVTELFDWLMGTSTGGVLALLLLRGKCLRCCRNLLFSFKNEVFCGRRPYCSENLEKILHREMGEGTVMTDLKGIRVAVTTLVSDRCPPVLHMFRNYISPRVELHNMLSESQHRSYMGTALSRNTMFERNRSSGQRHNSGTSPCETQNGRTTSLTYSSSLVSFLLSASGFQNAGDTGPIHGSRAEAENEHHFDPITPDSEMPVWKAARATGAAPTYFRPCGRFLDGGLISNNPTLDLLTELQELHMAQQLKKKPPVPLAVVVSLGTGRMPVEPIETVDVFRPQSLMETFRSAMGVSSLGRIVVEVATMSEGPVVDRASAWCASLGVPFFRFSPRLSLHITLDQVDTKELLQMVWEAEAYIHSTRDRIEHLASML